MRRILTAASPLAIAAALMLAVSNPTTASPPPSTIPDATGGTGPASPLPTSNGDSNNDVEAADPATNNGDGTFDVTASSGGEASSPGVPPGPVTIASPSAGARCSAWADEGSLEDPGAPSPRITRTLADGTIQTLQIRYCTDPTRTDRRWVNDGVDPTVVRTRAIDVARGRVPVPVPDINPGVDVGSYVNLGLWLATEPVELEPVVAEAGGYRVTAIVTLESSVFELGDDTVVECEGAGDPIPGPGSREWDSVEPSPVCGHVYRQSSPNEDPYVISIAATSRITWSDNRGGSGDAGTITMTSQHPYDVDELQTLGTGA